MIENGGNPLDEVTTRKWGSLTPRITRILKFSFLVEIQTDLAFVRRKVPERGAGLSTGNSKVGPSLPAKESFGFGTGLAPLFQKPRLGLTL